VSGLGADTATQLVTFDLDAYTYGIDVHRVQEVLRSQPRTRVPLSPESLAGLINLRGQVLTTVDLRHQLGLPRRSAGAPEPVLVIVRVGGEPFALMADRVGAVVEVRRDTFEPPPDTLSGPARDVIRGAYKLEHGVLIALDVERAVTVTVDPRRAGR
jgi:purine-binding chemotaxis protein CheW